MNTCQECHQPCERTYCSQTCSNRFHGKAKWESNKSNANRVCDTCHTYKSKCQYSLVVKYHPEHGYRPTCKQCSANARERDRRNRSWKHHAAQVLMSNSKQRAKRAGMEHTLTLADIVIPDVCPVFDIPLKREDRVTWRNAPSIDRIDNTRGYTPDNIVVVSRRANLLKKDATVAEMKALAEFYSRYES